VSPSGGLTVHLEALLPASLLIDLPTASPALSRSDRLEDFRTEVVPQGGDRYQVVVELGGPDPDVRVRESLARIESWRESAELNFAEIHLNDRPIDMRATDPPPALAAPPSR
jgi:hypothetical protein